MPWKTTSTPAAYAMLISDEPIQAKTVATSDDRPNSLRTDESISGGLSQFSSDENGTVPLHRALSDELKSLLEKTYGVEFTIFDGPSGQVLHVSPSQPARDWEALAETCREAARRGGPEFLDEEDPLLTLALPLVASRGNETVAVATFLTRPVAKDEDVSRAAKTLGMAPGKLRQWAQSQTPWTAESLKRISDLALGHARARDLLKSLEAETTSLSLNLASTYEEISLLYRLTQNLKISKSDEELGLVALEWMQEVVPAAGLAIKLSPATGNDKGIVCEGRGQMVWLTRGDCPIDAAEFSALMKHVVAATPQRPIVMNAPVTSQPDWPCPKVRQLIAVALAEGENVFGWLAAMNHAENGEFGTVEATLLSSVAAILGIHGGNIELYRQQSELLAGIVRALTSAIDAKDPYTRGHSDRVARIAVLLAQKLGCDAKMINTLYLAGLLHDIGKIGVNDSVLHKAGNLSAAEYEHIKQHVEIGHHILHDLAKLEEVLPVVLHHHESWDGGGYPLGLGSKRIPLAARIVAVADAYDAMSSDRPYRRGMPIERVEQILPPAPENSGIPR